MNLRACLVTLSAAAVFTGCSQSGPGKFKDEVLAADKAFSEASKKDGIQAAFLRVIAPDAKLLGDPHSGADAVRFTYMRLPPTATLTWEPAFVDVSSSGDLGYTWGRYTLVLQNVTKGKPPSIARGSYVTVWRHEPDGSWKVVLDGGTPDRER